MITTDGLLVESSPPSPQNSFIPTSRDPRSPVSHAQFLLASHLDQDDLRDILILYEHRLTRRFIRRGYLRPMTPGLPAPEQTFALHWGHEPPSEEDAQLLKCYAACTKLRHAFGPKAGQPLTLDQGDEPSSSDWSGALCITHSGFNLHADTVIEATDRDRLEQLCRYIQRPTIAQDRLQELSDGRFYYRFKRVWKNGTRGIFFEGADHPLRQNFERLDQLKSISFHRVIDDEPIEMSADDLWLQLNYQLIHLVDFLPVSNWTTHANDTSLIIFRDLYDLLDRSGRLEANIQYVKSPHAEAVGESRGLGSRLASMIPAGLSERMAGKSIRQFSERIGHSLAYELEWSS